MKLLHDFFISIFIILVFSVLYKLVDIYEVKNHMKMDYDKLDMEDLSKLKIVRKANTDKYYFDTKDIPRNDKYKSWFQCLYDSFITHSTIGFGQYYPISSLAYLVNSIHLLIVIIYIRIMIMGNIKLFRGIILALSAILFFGVVNYIVFRIEYKKKAKVGTGDLFISELKDSKLKFNIHKHIMSIKDKTNYFGKISFWDSLYYSIITQSTVGYGAIWYPVTNLERVVSIMQCIIVIILFFM